MPLSISHHDAQCRGIVSLGVLRVAAKDHRGLAPRLARQAPQQGAEPSTETLAECPIVGQKRSQGTPVWGSGVHRAPQRGAETVTERQTASAWGSAALHH